MRRQCGGRPVCIGIVLVAAIVLLSAVLSESAKGQMVQQYRSAFTVGVTRKDGSILPLLLAQRVMPFRIVSVTPESGLLALNVNEIDLLYTDTASGLLSALKSTDLVFIAGGLDYVTGSIFASSRVTGFSDPNVAQRAIGDVISFRPSRVDTALTFEILAIRAVLRQQKINTVVIASLAGKEANSPDVGIKSLVDGQTDFAYVSAELDPVFSAAKLKKLNFAPVALQGVVVAARKSRISSSRAQFQDFSRAFASGIRTYLDPKGASEVLAVLRNDIGLDEASAEHVFIVFRDTKAFRNPPTPNAMSVSNLIRELSFVIPEVKKLSVQRLIDTGFF